MTTQPTKVYEVSCGLHHIIVLATSPQKAFQKYVAKRWAVWHPKGAIQTHDSNNSGLEALVEKVKGAGKYDVYISCKEMEHIS